MDLRIMNDIVPQGVLEQRFCSCKNDCSCGEETEPEWEWDVSHASRNVQLSKKNLEVNLNHGWSSGTSAIRGNAQLLEGKHHYWEVKMVTEVYGTDIMIGVGTKKVDLGAAAYTYSSLLGQDSESWGLSYTGTIQHAGIKTPYCGPFKQGSLIGIHIDTWRGTLEYYMNRKPLGTAFVDLRGTELYAMVSSTAASSKLRLTHASSVPANLQFDCLIALPPSLKATLGARYPGLRDLANSIFADIVSSKYETDEYELLDDFTHMDEFDMALVGFKKIPRVLGQDDGSMPGTARHECERCGNTTSILTMPPLCTMCWD